MKKSLCYIAASFAAVGALVFTMSSCGESGSSTKVSKDGMFGEVPAIVADFGDQSIGLIEKVAKSNDEKEMENLLTNKKEEIEKTANDALVAAIEKLKDKEFPIEVSSETPIQITSPLKIDTEKSELENVWFTATAKNTGKLSLGYGNYLNNQDIRAILVDKEGAPICAILGGDNIYKTRKADGNTVNEGTEADIRIKIKFTPANALLLSKAEKFVIVTIANDMWKPARDTTRSEEKAYTQRVTDAAKLMMEKMKELKEKK